MTTDAVQRGDAVAIWSADDIGEVPVTIVALLRIVGGSVTVDAAWRDEYGVDLLPCCQSGGSILVTGFSGECNSYRKNTETQSDNRREQSVQCEH
jgi:hypothetical protein